MSDSNGQAATPFTQAARAADELLDRLSDYQSALDEVAGLRSDVGTLRDQVAAAIAPTQALAVAAHDAADTYDGLRHARPQIEEDLGELLAAIEASTGVAAASIEKTGVEAAERVEASAGRAVGRVDDAVQALKSSLNRVRKATEEIERTASTKGLVAAGALVEALEAATGQVRADAARTMDALAEPSRLVDAALLRARESAGAVRVELQSAVEEAVAAHRTALREAEAEYARTRGRDVQRLTRIGWATLAAVVVFGLLSLVWRPDADPGLDLSASTVQVLNGVDPNADFAAEVASVLPVGLVGAVVRGDAPTTRQGETYVLVHGASMEAGRTLADKLGMDPSRVRPGAPVPYAGHLTVLLGADFREAIPATAR